MSNEKGLSAECIACDRAGSHGKHGSASMLMAWRSAPPNACRKCELGEQLEVERRTFSKICDRSRERNRLPLATTVADLRCHSQCAVQLFPEGSRSTRTHPVAFFAESFHSGLSAYHRCQWRPLRPLPNNMPVDGGYC